MKKSTVAALQLSIRSAVSAGLSVALAQLLHLQYPLYALVGAVIVTDLSPQQTRELGVQRLAGTVLGAGLGATLSHFLPASPWAIGFGILISIFLSHVFHLRGAAKVSGYICGIIMLNYHDDQWSYALSRLIETMLGILVALAVSHVPKLISAEKFAEQE